jgi:hypothetical protein
MRGIFGPISSCFVLLYCLLQTITILCFVVDENTPSTLRQNKSNKSVDTRRIFFCQNDRTQNVTFIRICDQSYINVGFIQGTFCLFSFKLVGLILFGKILGHIPSFHYVLTTIL